MSCLEAKNGENFVKRCSTCGNYKSPQDFNGRATCDSCRLKKRDSNHRNLSLQKDRLTELEQENEALKATSHQQTLELCIANQWKGEVQRLCCEIAQQEIQLERLQGDRFVDPKPLQRPTPRRVTPDHMIVL